MHSPVRIFRLLFIFALLTLALNPVIQGGAAASGPGGLVRLENPAPDLRQALVAGGTQIYARLFTMDGQEVLYLPLHALPQSPQLRSANLQTLDDGTQAGSYYLAWIASESAQQAVYEHAVVLDELGVQAVILANPEQEAALQDGGVHATPLALHTFREYQLVPVAPQIEAPDPYVAAFINQVSQSAVVNQVRQLSGETPVSIGSNQVSLVTRYTPNETAITRATRYVHDTLASYGLNTAYDYYDLNYAGVDYGERRSVVAEQTGVLYPDKIFFITAHMDSRSENSSTSYSIAPGADDNGSGTTAVLTAAQILSQHSFAYTIRYVLFTGEEQWMKGSQPYTAGVAARGEQVLGVINLDMIGNNTHGIDEFELHVRPGESGDLAIAQTFDQVADVYQLGLRPLILFDGLNFSDHSSFWTYDYPAILAMEDYISPNWHRQTDTVSNLDRAYFTEAVKAAVGTLAHLAVFYSPNLQGTITHSELLGPVSRAQISLANTNFSQIVTTDEQGSYRLMIPGGTYNVSVQAAGFAPLDQSNVAVPDPLTGTLLNLDFDLCQLLASVSWYPSPLPPQPGQPVTLSAVYSAGSPPFTYSWTVGGGPTETMPVIVHTFNAAGVYPVSLVVANRCDTQEATYNLAVGGYPFYLPMAALMPP